jgi:chemotaxis protein methyltransferase CheR
MNPFAASAVPAAPPAGRRAGAPVDDYLAFCGGVRRLTGIDLEQYKRPQMERRVRTFCERRGTPDLGDYAKQLASDGKELEAFLDRVTINVSQLWRNPDQWTRLESTILPELAKSSKPAGRLKAWSAGCSYGAEAFTLAALSKQVGIRQADITGTDIDKRIIARAKTGVFSADDARDAPSSLLSRFFEAQPDGCWKARQELQSLVRFEAGDLLRLKARPEAYDLVLCRNTVIYFTDEVRDALHARLAESVRPGGYFVVGSTERVARPADLGLEAAYPFTYRKVS